MRPHELERRLQERLHALGPAPRAELLHVLMLPDFERKPTERVRIVELIGIGVIAVPTIAVAYVYLRWHLITTRSAERQGRAPYTQADRALLLICLLGGIVATIMRGSALGRLRDPATY